MRCLQAWRLAGSPGGAELGENTLAHDDDRRFQAHSCGGELVCSDVLGWMGCLSRQSLFCGVLGVTLARDDDRLGQAHKLEFLLVLVW